MALPYAMFTALLLVSPVSAMANESLEHSKSKDSVKIVDVECTNISLEYFSGGRFKTSTSDDCPDSKENGDTESEYKKNNDVKSKSSR